MISQLGLYCTATSRSCIEKNWEQQSNLICFDIRDHTVTVCCCQSTPGLFPMLTSLAFPGSGPCGSGGAILEPEVPSLDLCFQNVPWPSNVGAPGSRLGNKCSSGSTSCHPVVTWLWVTVKSHDLIGLRVFCSEGRAVSSSAWSFMYKASGEYKWKTIPYGSKKKKAPLCWFSHRSVRWRRIRPGERRDESKTLQSGKTTTENHQTVKTSSNIPDLSVLTKYLSPFAPT